MNLMENNKIVLRNNEESVYLKIIELIIIGLICLVPLAFYPYCITVFLPAKELVVEILTLTALMFWGLKIVSQERLSFQSSPLNLPILSFMMIGILSLVWSSSFFISLKGLLLFLSGPLLFFIVINNVKEEKQIYRFLYFLILLGSLFGIYGILQYNGIDFSFWIRNIGRQQVFGLFGNVNYFAEYLIIPLPVAISFFFIFRNKFHKILVFFSIIVMGLSLIFTFTRGSYLALGVALIVMFLLFLSSQGKGFLKKNKKIFLLIIILIFIISILFIVPNPLNQTGTVLSKIKERITLTQLAEDNSFKARLATWKSALIMIKERPWLGLGIGTFKYNSLRYIAKFLEQGENRSFYPALISTEAHNEYLQFWAEIGIFGLLIFIWIIVSYFKYCLKMIKKIEDEAAQGILIGMIGAVVAILVDSIFGFPLHLPASVSLFWLIIALSITIIRIKVCAEENKKFVKKIDKSVKEDKKELLFNTKNLLSIGIVLFAVFLSTLIIRPFMARTFWFSGNKELNAKRVNNAMKYYEQALRWDPYLGEVYYQMGKILQSRKIYNIALEYFEKAEKYVDHLDLPQDLATIYLRKNLFDKAAIKLKQAISYQGDEKSMLPLYNQLGSIYFSQKNYKQAEMAFKNALEIDPNFVNSHYGLATVYLQQNRPEEALQELQRVIELAPDSGEATSAREIIQQIAQTKLKSQPMETNNP
ncbi:MAG: hypothetical protein Kow00103_08140 [Candidatus Caldatribacteriota bacterium]